MNKSNAPNKQPLLFRRLYNWFTRWAEKPQADKALFGFSFAEAIFFPIPPDPLLMAMVFNKPKKYLRYALITVVASIVGGVIGYFVGWGLFESVGSWIISTFNLQDEYLSLGQSFENNGFIAVLAAAMTPIPYKIITISAGAFQINFFSFILASIVGRSLRFFGVAYLAKVLGLRYKEKIEKYINIISLVILVVAVLLFLVLS